MWNQDVTQQGYGQQQLALPPPLQQQPTINAMEESVIAAIDSIKSIGVTTAINFEEIMIRSGAAAHVCPPWFGTSVPLDHMDEASKPQLRTATDNNTYVYGYREIHFANHRGQHIVIPFYLCDVKHPILPGTRLVHQGFEISLKDNGTMTHQK